MTDVKDTRSPDNIALLDLDGTVADWHGALDRDLKNLLGTECERLSPEALDRVKHLIRRQSGWYRNLKPIPLGMQIEKTLREIGFTIMVATKAKTHTPNAWTEKAEWCMEHLPHAQVTISEDKTQIYGKILVDDYPKFADPWLKHRPRGIVIMPDQEWNQDYEHPRVHRVKTAKDVIALSSVLIDVYNR